MMEKKKVGILTLQYGLNYGGLLQAYALKETLIELGYDAVILDRIPDDFGWKFVIKRALVHPLTHRSFATFRRNELKPITSPILTSQKLSEILNHGYFACVVGSDQVWRKDVFSVSGDYFLINQKKINIKKVSYAASFGIGEWEYDEYETSNIIDSLNKFQGISVREKDAVRLLEENCKIESVCVLDPTLLARKDLYLNLIKKSKINASGKLVTYILDWTNEKKTFINNISNSHNYQILDILPPVVGKPSIISKIFGDTCSIYDWLNQIATAEIVVTDSFHGMVFSIIFNKQFWVIGNKERGLSRFMSLLDSLGLSHRLFRNLYSCDTIPIDYMPINNKLDVLRQFSKNFLINSLK